jgi:hypothetical protein
VDELSHSATQRMGAKVLASATVNTDFAETEVDTRRTNLTRFPLFFPEKRTFFLEGGDILSFGLGLNQDVLPYFSRRIGLIEGHEVPILAGGQVNGRIGDTNFGGLAVGTRDQPGVVSENAFMAAGRVKRNIWEESWIGAIVTAGDPQGRPDGSYEWRRYRLEASTAQKRRLYAQLTWWFGGFYDGTLDQFHTLDLPASSRFVRRLQPQHPVGVRPLVAGLESTPDQAAVRAGGCNGITSR